MKLSLVLMIFYIATTCFASLKDLDYKNIVKLQVQREDLCVLLKDIEMGRNRIQCFNSKGASPIEFPKEIYHPLDFFFANDYPLRCVLSQPAIGEKTVICSGHLPYGIPETLDFINPQQLTSLDGNRFCAFSADEFKCFENERRQEIVQYQPTIKPIEPPFLNMFSKYNSFCLENKHYISCPLGLYEKKIFQEKDVRAILSESKEALEFMAVDGEYSILFHRGAHPNQLVKINHFDDELIYQNEECFIFLDKKLNRKYVECKNYRWENIETNNPRLVTADQYNICVLDDDGIKCRGHNWGK